MAVALRPVLAGLGGCLAVLVMATCHSFPSQAVSSTSAQAVAESDTSSGVCAFDLSDDKEQTVFFLLGFLDEYLGRYVVEGDDRVERFYATEAAKAEVFRQYLARLANQQKLDATILEGREGSGIVFHSKPLADGLNSCYQLPFTSGRMAPGADGTYRRTATATLDLSLFMKTGKVTRHDQPGLSDEVFRRSRALAYVAGAWMRYGRVPDFAFANSRHKAELIAQLLVNLGCVKVSVEEIFGFVPHATYVHFRPTDEVKEWLSRKW